MLFCAIISFTVCNQTAHAACTMRDVMSQSVNALLSLETAHSLLCWQWRLWCKEPIPPHTQGCLMALEPGLGSCWTVWPKHQQQMVDFTWISRNHFNISMLPWQQKKSHCGDKIVVSSFYPTMGFPTIIRLHLYSGMVTKWEYVAKCSVTFI